MLNKKDSTKYSCKKLFLKSKNQSKSKPSQVNTFAHLSASTVPTVYHVSNVPTVSNFNYIENFSTTKLCTESASVGKLDLFTNKLKNETILTNNSNNFIFKNVDTETVSFTKKGVDIKENLNVKSNISTSTLNVETDIISKNIISKENLVSSFAEILKNLNVKGILNVEDSLNVENDINVNNIFLNYLQANTIDTNQIISESDIHILPAENGTINVPNIKFEINYSDCALIDSFSIKNSKFFILRRNVILTADETCNGIEIILYNDNPCKEIVVRDACGIINFIPGKVAVQIIYLADLKKWIFF